MSKAAKTQPARKSRSVLDDKLDEQLAAREKVEAKISAAGVKRSARLARVEKKYQKDLGGATKKLDRIDQGLTGFLERHRYWLTRRHSKTVQREHGEVKVVLRALELELPADEKPIIDFLLSRQGGKEYIEFVPKLNKRRLLQAPAKLYAELRSLGVWRGRHRTISVKSPSSSKAKQLSSRRYNDRSA